MSKFIKLFINAIPVLLMIALILVIASDYLLVIVYLAIISLAFVVKCERNELGIFVAGFVLMIVFEYLFVTTKVETFARNSLFGLMPLWLPLLWGYGFVAIKRGVRILDK